ncbi:MAG: PadR family transcriptional regulator [Sphingomonadaceae bacterium]
MWYAGSFGSRRFRERIFEKGDLKYVILDLLAEKPRHGYEIIRELEERFGGVYSPSPGAVYPTLQLLEDLAYVISSQRDGRRIYEITQEGRAFLAARNDTMEHIRGRVRSRLGPWFGEEGAREFAEEVREFAADMKDFAKMFAKSQGGAWRDPAKRDRIRELLKRTRQEIDDILREPDSK